MEFETGVAAAWQLHLKGSVKLSWSGSRPPKGPCVVAQASGTDVSFHNCAHDIYRSCSEHIFASIQKGPCGVLLVHDGSCHRHDTRHGCGRLQMHSVPFRQTAYRFGVLLEPNRGLPITLKSHSTGCMHMCPHCTPIQRLIQRRWIDVIHSLTHSQLAPWSSCMKTAVYMLSQ